MIGTAVLLHILFRLPWALIEGPAALALPSLEAFLAIAILAWVPQIPPKPGKLVVWILALIEGFTLLFGFSDAFVRRTFNRPLSLVTDAGYVPDLYGLLRDTLPLPVFGVGLVALPLFLAAFVWGFRRISDTVVRSARRVPRRWAFLAGLGVFLVLLETLAGVPVLGSSSLPRMAQEARGVLGYRRYEAETREGLQRVAQEAMKVESFPLDRLAGRDVFLFIVESYGYTLYSEPGHFEGAEPYLRKFEARLQEAGYHIRSAFLSSPAFGGNSWLADSTLASGVWIADQVAYEALLESELIPMAQRFNEAGYLTVNSMPATTLDWPQGEYFKFSKKYYYRDFAYQGPSFRWAPMPDQYAIDVVHRDVVAPSEVPIFVQFVMISGHYPFSLLPRRLDDWSELGDGAVFTKRENVRSIPIPKGAATAGAPGYLAAMEYQLDVVSDYMARFLADRKPLVIILGDHQPYSGITGTGKLRSVPIHVLCQDPEVLESFRIRGYTPGWIPRQAPPHPGLDTVYTGLLEDFTSVPEAGARP
ncbi:MAG: hypothetical protein A2Y38_16045 [Spirochaetes bacterium GWB1_59_5]|nr:MAG: hypothetical protein A2Y38_16045 [Spirochaetes bacterium GWB1_59_5]